ncbi:MAG: M16 family metallopeptidase [Planctomycetota bacterium]|jgi:predicted Zn-dependent peptidase
MQQQDVYTHTFENGLTLILEQMKDVQSAAFAFMVPAGCIYDPEDGNGTAAMLADWITRGAGERNSRELFTTLDNLGLQRAESAGANHITFSGATVADQLGEVFRVYGDILLRPSLPEEQFEAIQLGAEQALLAVEDEPQRRVMVELRRRSFRAPWGRSSDGRLEDLPNITPQSVKHHYQRHFHPNDAIIGIAGNVDVDATIKLIGDVFGGWESGPSTEIEPGDCGPARDFIEFDSAQTHIGVSYDSIPFDHPDYYTAWAATSVLSGGMSARLFTEVRERRGLCYSIYASQASMKHEGRVLCYAGTSNERAQETLDVTLQELKRLGDGIEESELERCKARAKSSLVMQQESSRGRAGSLARNWFLLGRVRTLEEVRDRIDALTVNDVLEYVHQHPASDFTVLTVGPKPLDVND